MTILKLLKAFSINYSFASKAKTAKLVTENVSFGVFMQNGCAKIDLFSKNFFKDIFL